ncbi:MAG: alpha-L-fucosidase [Prevotella sp.]|nr:alpha-L-fucosidase [Prevotella sp.]
MKERLLGAIAMLALPILVNAQLDIDDTQTIENSDNTPAPVHPVPSERQLLWNETEFYAFFHFGMNTFTNKEWGDGSESETNFAPTKTPNPEQWLTAAKAAGMKGGIAVVKHHDGFCLWPTATTTHSTSRSSGYGKDVNIPLSFATAAQKLGMKYGFYISPWDRNSSLYGTQDYIDNVFIPQCEELAQYGSDQFEMWFDGANGGSGYYGGKNTTISIGSTYIDRVLYYDAPNLRDRIHKLAPNCVMWGVGGEARWIGNEDGYANATNWATDSRNDENNNEQGTEDYWLWNPGESDVCATDKGWFWHSGENVKSAEQLFTYYMQTVGRNATLILNIPPDKTGELPQATVNRMTELGNLLRSRLGTDLAVSATASATRSGGSYNASNLIDNDKDTYWATDDGATTANVTIDLGSTKTVRYVMLQEYIRLGQRVQGFSIQYSTDGNTWRTASSSEAMTTIGYKRIIPLNGSVSGLASGYQARYIRVNITESKACPLLHTVAVY